MHDDMPKFVRDLPVTTMSSVCREAWYQGLFSGCNGNASLRFKTMPEYVCITRSGAAKGRLAKEDLCVVLMDDGRTLYGGPTSTEAGMHLAVYRVCPECQAILHTHPRHLLALSLRLSGNVQDFLNLPLFEAKLWRSKLGFVPALPPGSRELASAVAHAAIDKPAVWMADHGLCATGQSLTDALCLTEELEHVAHVQLLSLT